MFDSIGDFFNWLADCPGDPTCVEGVAATVASTIVFCGSVFLLLMFVMGARLAYFITASVTLAFLLIMGVIWSFTNALAPLGPVGILPEWEPISVAEQGEDLEGPSASEYPDGGGWTEVDEEDDAQTQQAAELGSAGLDAIADGVEEGIFPEETENNTADTSSIRFLEQDDELYGGVTLKPPATEEAEAAGTATEEAEAEPPPVVVAIMRYDPGDPLGKPRGILAGTVVLLGIHLFFLSRSEKRARRAREATA